MYSLFFISIFTFSGKVASANGCFHFELMFLQACGHMTKHRHTELSARVLIRNKKHKAKKFHSPILPCMDHSLEGLNPADQSTVKRVVWWLEREEAVPISEGKSTTAPLNSLSRAQSLTQSPGRGPRFATGVTHVQRAQWEGVAWCLRG